MHWSDTEQLQDLQNTSTNHWQHCPVHNSQMKENDQTSNPSNPIDDNPIWSSSRVVRPAMDHSNLDNSQNHRNSIRHRRDCHSHNPSHPRTSHSGESEYSRSRYRNN